MTSRELFGGMLVLVSVNGSVCTIQTADAIEGLSGRQRLIASGPSRAHAEAEFKRLYRAHTDKAFPG